MTDSEILFSVVTTIASPTKSLCELAVKVSEVGGKLVVVGDRKGPGSFNLDRSHFLDIEQQGRLPLQVANLLPENHYARKNIAYLFAMQRGAACVYETDDDNSPLASWTSRSETVSGVRTFQAKSDDKQVRWINVYRYFTDQAIWPRGFPLDQISAVSPPLERATGSVRAPIQQGLVNNSPDVDAIWRLTQDRPFSFDDAPSVQLPPGNWCPFNTQSTWWWPEAYPLMYIPSYCSFRMCDIWKSFVAQRCLWELDCEVVFHAPEVVQDRNVHNLMKDFEDEIPGYLQNSDFVRTLADLRLTPGPGNVIANVIRCYEALAQRELFRHEELKLVRAWIHDIESIMDK